MDDWYHYPCKIIIKQYKDILGIKVQAIRFLCTMHTTHIHWNKIA